MKWFFICLIMVLSQLCPAKLRSDLNGDCKVDIQDLAIMMSEWLQNEDCMSLGPELVTNGTFDTNTDWSFQNAIAPGWAISGGVLRFDKDALHLGSTGDFTYQSILVETGKTYTISYTLNVIDAVFGTGVTISIGNVSATPRLTSGNYSEALVMDDGDPVLLILMGNIGQGSLTIDNVSVKEGTADTESTIMSEIDDSLWTW